MKIGSPQEPDLEIDEVSAWTGSTLRARLTRKPKGGGDRKRKRAEKRAVR